jgi:hypothetical protein
MDLQGLSANLQRLFLSLLPYFNLSGVLIRNQPWYGVRSTRSGNRSGWLSINRWLGREEMCMQVTCYHGSPDSMIVTDTIINHAIVFAFYSCLLKTRVQSTHAWDKHQHSNYLISCVLLTFIQIHQAYEAAMTTCLVSNYWVLREIGKEVFLRSHWLGNCGRNKPRSPEAYSPTY